MADPAPNQFNEVAEVYDNLMSVVPYAWWVNYVRGLWRQFGWEPKRVLDLACGTGNVLLELRRRGYEVAGVDGSEAMIRVARRKVPAEVPLYYQDFRALSLSPPPFDACVCLFDSLNYLLHPNDLLQTFRGVRRHLVPGGLLVFDMNAIRALETGMFNQTGTGRDSTLQYEWHSAWEPATRLCTIEMEFRASDRDGPRVFHETHVQRGYTQEEITGALEHAGFELLALYDGYTTDPPNPKTDRYYVVAKRET